jgi:hypothetical protein
MTTIKECGESLRGALEEYLDGDNAALVTTLEGLNGKKAVKANVTRLVAAFEATVPDDAAYAAELWDEMVEYVIAKDILTDWLPLLEGRIKPPRVEDAKENLAVGEFKVDRVRIALEQADGRKTPVSVWWPQQRMCLQKAGVPKAMWFELIKQAVEGELKDMFWLHVEGLGDVDNFDAEVFCQWAVGIIEGFLKDELMTTWRKLEQVPGQTVLQFRLAYGTMCRRVSQYVAVMDDLQQAKDFANRLLCSSDIATKMFATVEEVLSYVSKKKLDKGVFGAIGGHGQYTCYNCGTPGHRSFECKEGAVSRQFEGKCFKCGQPGHRFSVCKGEKMVIAQKEKPQDEQPPVVRQDLEKLWGRA